MLSVDQPTQTEKLTVFNINTQVLYSYSPPNHVQLQSPRELVETVITSEDLPPSLPEEASTM